MIFGYFVITTDKVGTVDTTLLGAILHASDVLMNDKVLNKKQLEHLYLKIGEILKKMKANKIKNSQLYSRLVQAFWPQYPRMVSNC